MLTGLNPKLLTGICDRNSWNWMYNSVPSDGCHLPQMRRGEFIARTITNGLQQSFKRYPGKTAWRWFKTIRGNERYFGYGGGITDRISYRAALQKLEQQKQANRHQQESNEALEHLTASHALVRGAPISLVQATLGHSSVATTGRYLHARPSDSLSKYLPL